jgi:hypothetical protein
VNDFFAREFWRFVMVQQFVGKLALTAVDYPPMQDPASFNLDAVKKKVEEISSTAKGNNQAADMAGVPKRAPRGWPRALCTDDVI